MKRSGRGVLALVVLLAACDSSKPGAGTAGSGASGGAGDTGGAGAGGAGAGGAGAGGAGAGGAGAGGAGGAGATGGAGAGGEVGELWQRARDLPVPVTEVAVVAVGSKLYALGGFAATGETRAVYALDLASFEEPQPSWRAVAPLPAASPAHHLQVAAHGGKVYVLGGYDGIAFSPSAATFAYDPATDAWAARAAQPVRRGAGTAQALGDRILVAGGVTPEGVTGRVHAYDPVADAWSERAPLPTPREHLASCAIGQGASPDRLLVAGGRTTTNLAVAELYDPATDRWEAVAPLPTARGGLAAAGEGARCLVFGGERLGAPVPNTHGEAEEFDLATRAWRAHLPMPTPRHGLGAFAFRVAARAVYYVIGGGPTAGFSYSPLVEVLSFSP